MKAAVVVANEDVQYQEIGRTTGKNQAVKIKVDIPASVDLMFV